MGNLRESGSTDFTLEPRGGAGAPPQDALLASVREAAAGEYEVFGEITRGHDGSVVYLARDEVEARLVVLKLTRSGEDDYYLEVVQELDASVAAPEGVCPSCQAPLRQWGRYCTRCGTDLWGTPSGSGDWTRQELLQAVKEVAADKYEILGEIPRAGGAGYVYFGRDLSTGKIGALRLLKEDANAFSLGQTGLLRRMASESPPRPRPAPPPVDTPETTLPDPVLPGYSGPAPQVEPPPPPTRTTDPRAAAYDAWSQLLEFLRQPLVLAIVAVTAAAVVITMCAIVLSSEAPPAAAPDEPAAREVVSEPEAPAAAAAPTVEDRVLGYSVLIASFGTLDEALRRQRELAGVNAMYYTAPTSVEGTVYHRLFAAMLPGRGEAATLMTRLVREGVKSSFRSWDIRPAALAFFLGSYESRREADLAIDALLLQDIPAYRVPAAGEAGATRYYVYAGGFEAAAEARYLQSLLAEAGLEAELVERVGLPVP